MDRLQEVLEDGKSVGGREGQVVCFLSRRRRCRRRGSQKYWRRRRGSHKKAVQLKRLSDCTVRPVLVLRFCSLSPTCFFLQPIRELRKANATSCAQKGEEEDEEKKRANNAVCVCRRTGKPRHNFGGLRFIHRGEGGSCPRPSLIKGNFFLRSSTYLSHPPSLPYLREKNNGVSA